ncbi:MAG: hypothetical protein WBL19_01795 [Minisyncoccia bacterium]
MIRKKYITGLLVLSIFATSFLPAFAPKAKALFGASIVLDPTVNMSIIFDTGLTLANMAARVLAQAILQRMIESTVQWANDGFEGNPAYVTDPDSFFTNIADSVAGEIIRGSDLGYLCSPFQNTIRRSLQQNYVNRGSWMPQNRYQCTLTNVVGNIEGFYDDFSQGGWQGWFGMTQRSSNNPYGAFLQAQADLDERIAKRLDLQREQLGWDSGFLSWRECTGGRAPGSGECLGFGPTKTPGSVIANQLNQVLPANMQRFINAQNLEDLVAAFVSGALNRYVFSSSDGLFSSAPPPPRVPPSPPPPTSGAGAVQTCMNNCINLYCPSSDPNSGNCNQPALNRCVNGCAGFTPPAPVPGPGGPFFPGPGPGPGNPIP